MTQQVRDDGGAPVPVLRPGAVQKVNVTTTSAATAAAVGGEVVRVVASVDCHFALGTAPTATANDHYLPAGVLEYLRVVAGEKVAFLRAGTLDGIVTVTDME